MRRARVLVVLAALLVGSAWLLTACGQKGPLYLPEDTDTEKQQQRKQSGD